MEAINYIAGEKNMVLTEDAQIVQGVSGNGCYLPAGTGKIALKGDRNELSVSLWRQWDGVVEQDAKRGVFSFTNIVVFFDNKTDLLTVIINGFKAITDIKDEQKQAHWCFTFAKNGRFIIYKDAKEVYSLIAGDKPVDMTDGFTLGGGKTHAAFDEVRVYKVILTQGEINGLFYLVSKGTQVGQLENIVQSATPKYLGVTETVPATRTAIITKGERLGAQDANPGDWVLMSKTSGGWKCGVCYRWTGTLWINLEPEANYVEQYHACLLHICEIPELMKNTGHFGALFAKVIVAQEAFIKKLAADQAFLKELIVQRLRIDSDKNSDTDFEVDINNEIGILAKYKNKTVFAVDPIHGAYFSGSIYTGPLELDNTPEKIPDYKKETASTFEVVDFLYDKQHIPMKIYIDNNEYNLISVHKRLRPYSPDNIGQDKLKTIFGNINYHMHITENNEYRKYFRCDVYYHIVYHITNYILLSGGKKYQCIEAGDWWKKIASHLYYRYLGENIPANALQYPPPNIYNNERKEDTYIHNIHIKFSPAHKLLKLKGLPAHKVGLSKDTVYIENGHLKIVQ